jgi:hypothetical protein
MCNAALRKAGSGNLVSHPVAKTGELRRAY